MVKKNGPIKDGKAKIKDNFRAYIVFPVTPDQPMSVDEEYYKETENKLGKGKGIKRGEAREHMYHQWQTVHRVRDSWDALSHKKWGGLIQAVAEHVYKALHPNKKCKKGEEIIRPKIEGEGADTTSSWNSEKDEVFKHVSRYIKIFNLRTSGKLNGEFVTEQIYVHTKMMIVDDRVAIIGSANFSDRSTIIGRIGSDSEMAAVVVDNEDVQSTMNGRPAKVRKFARDLRLKLWNEHLGLPANSKLLEDPVSDNTHKIISKRAQKNTDEFDAAFPGLPSNKYPDLMAQFKDLKNRKSDSAAQEHLKKVKGHLVDFPLVWLWKDDNVIQDIALHPDVLYLKNESDKKDKTLIAASAKPKTDEA